ncbi:MAG: hypothetical protein M1832_004827 [Thelocarpon impressellum]|nr:MAG: hypothetical protein M1832_004827 [Thelocarpon impressellum]
MRRASQDLALASLFVLARSMPAVEYASHVTTEVYHINTPILAYSVVSPALSDSTSSNSSSSSSSSSLNSTSTAYAAVTVTVHDTVTAHDTVTTHEAASACALTPESSAGSYSTSAPYHYSSSPASSSSPSPSSTTPALPVSYAVLTSSTLSYTYLWNSASSVDTSSSTSTSTYGVLSSGTNSSTSHGYSSGGAATILYNASSASSSAYSSSSALPASSSYNNPNYTPASTSTNSSSAYISSSTTPQPSSSYNNPNYTVASTPPSSVYFPPSSVANVTTYPATSGPPISLAPNSTTLPVTSAPQVSIAPNSTTLPVTSLAPNATTPIATALPPIFTNTGCGPISEFFNSTQADWEKHKTGPWLDTWWSRNSITFEHTSGGFAAVFGAQHLGNPGWTCRDNGEDDTCDFNACNVPALNNQPKADMGSVYMILQSVSNLHGYFKGLGHALQNSAIGAALAKDDWADTFYDAKGVMNLAPLRNIMVVLNTLVGVAAAFAAFATPVVGALVAAGVAIFMAGTAFVTINAQAAVDDTFEKAADLGAKLGQVFTNSIKELITANDQLMRGANFEGAGDIRSFIAGGAYVGFGGIDKVKVMDTMSAMLVATSVNEMYRQQKIFIMGGGPCDDSGGLGEGPQEAKVCRDGKAWYLYFWKETKSFTLRAKRWGWLSAPPGMEKLGTGDFFGIHVEDIINASLDSYAVAEYNYTAQMGHERALNQLKNGLKNPIQYGAAWEGVFNIPICDVGGAAIAGIDHAEHILKKYDGNKSRPHWCGSICSNDEEKTKRFIAAAQMNNFKSPKHYCPD